MSSRCSTNDFLLHQYQKSGLLPGQSGTRTPCSIIKTRGTKMELCNQSSRFRLTEDRDFIINGLGLPFERHYFQAGAQLCYATDELLRTRRGRQLRGVSARRKAEIQPFTTSLSNPTPPLPSPLSLPIAVFASVAAGLGAVTLRRRARLHAHGPAAGFHPTGTDPRSRRWAPTGPAKGSPGLESQI